MSYTLDDIIITQRVHRSLQSQVFLCGLGIMIQDTLKKSMQTTSKMLF